ncbi:type IV toxin-antitoxin system AbiEi family antitoxin domain-containing protein [Sphingomonas sanguinis]|uniref:type IV toxin-antitoxin system AbiEi family antitoxin domain-containing protein n=1 Tax=Sphingomonas sanguinis TaxID=33051 RepID=UPI0019D392C7
MVDLLKQQIVPAFEPRNAGVHPPTISRAVADGELVRIARGLGTSRAFMCANPAWRRSKVS